VKKGTVHSKECVCELSQAG